MLDGLLGSRTRAGILTALVAENRRCGLLELQRLVGTSVSSVQKELVRLERIGLVRSRRVGGERHIEAVVSHPYHEALLRLLRADAEARGASRSRPGVESSVNRHVGPKVAEIAAACGRHGAVRAALVGSAAQVDTDVVPADLDILVRFEPDPAGYAERYFGLLEELERIMGIPVEIIEEDAVANPLLAAEFEATGVVVYEAA